MLKTNSSKYKLVQEKINKSLTQRAPVNICFFFYQTVFFKKNDNWGYTVFL